MRGLRSSSSKRVVLCGSMSSHAIMEAISRQLSSRGIRAVIPESDDKWAGVDDATMRKVKRKASLKHFELIRNDSTDAILVVNVDKNGVSDYIGPNAFAEIAVAFAENRRIFLLHGMPHAYADELEAWGAQCLHGNLAALAPVSRRLRSAQQHLARA